MRKLRSYQGFILAIAMMTALVASIFAYTVLALAVSQGRQARFFRNRTPTRYLAEAGMVIAQARLLNNPTTYCGGSQIIDTNGDGILQATEPSVTITVLPLGCPRAAGSVVTIQVTANN